VITCSRDVTCVLHLCKGWSEGMGGAFVDLEAPQAAAAVPHAAAAAPHAAGATPAENGGLLRGRVYVPRFNSAIFFRVPRYHAVTPLSTDRPRWVTWLRRALRMPPAAAGHAPPPSPPACIALLSLL
jgi:hypothetical protein